MLQGSARNPVIAASAPGAPRSFVPVQTRPRRELAQADDIEEFRVAEPAPLFNRDAPGPDYPAAKPEHRYGQKRFGDGAERRGGGLLQRESGRHSSGVLMPVM
jgi:hypothetical protein